MPESDPILAPEEADLQKSDDGDLYLVRGGRRRKIDRLVLCFPFSTPGGWVSLRDADGEELGLLRNLEGLPEGIRTHIRGRLEERYHIPRIRRILSVESGTGGSLWRAETDEGPVEFRLRGDTGVDLTGFPRILLTDVTTRKRVEIPDYTALDRSSQTLARSYLPLFQGGPHGGRRRFR